MASKYSIEKAAQAWCVPSTEHKVMDRELADAFADILDKELKIEHVMVDGTTLTFKNGMLVDIDRQSNDK